MDIKTNENHTATLTARLDWGDLKTIIFRHVLSGMDDDRFRRMFNGLPLGEIDVSIEQLKEGSPEYYVSRWRAVLKAEVGIPPA